jgi:hypothetical protein
MLYQIVPYHTTLYYYNILNCIILYLTYHRIPNTPHLPLSYIPNCTRPLQDNPTHLILESDESSVSTTEGSDSSCEAMEGPHGDDDGLVITNSSTSEDL